MSIIYDKRPTDGSQRAWDYIEKVYGKTRTMKFMPNCCGPQIWIAELYEGKTITIDSEELMGRREKT